MTQYQIVNYQSPVTNYGALTDISKALNEFFGDKTGRTVSSRTTKGFQNLFNAHHIEHNEAEFLIHMGMVTAGGLLQSEEEGNKATGFVLAVALLCCYQAGK